jgi:hypothetical protein
MANSSTVNHSQMFEGFSLLTDLLELLPLACHTLDSLLASVLNLVC